MTSLLLLVDHEAIGEVRFPDPIEAVSSIMALLQCLTLEMGHYEISECGIRYLDLDHALLYLNTPGLDTDKDNTEARGFLLDVVDFWIIDSGATYYNARM